MDLGLNGRVYLVAASSKGLGLGVARALATDGARVSLCSRTANEVELAAQQLATQFNTPTLATACDVTQPAEIAQWVERTLNTWGRVDGILVNAGGPPSKAFTEISDAEWQSAFELTLLSSIRMIRATLPHLTHGSAILTITSASVVEPIERLGMSTVMRAGVAGLVKTLADELAPQGIRVNNLIPGRIDTDRVAFLDQQRAQRLNISFEEARAQSLKSIPLGALGTVNEFGKAGAFLLSPAASYITGASLRVDGGMLRSI